MPVCATTVVTDSKASAADACISCDLDRRDQRRDSGTSRKRRSVSRVLVLKPEELCDSVRKGGATTSASTRLWRSLKLFHPVRLAQAPGELCCYVCLNNTGGGCLHISLSRWKRSSRTDEKTITRPLDRLDVVGHGGRLPRGKDARHSVVLLGVSGVAPAEVDTLAVLPALDARGKDQERDKRRRPLPADRRVPEDDLVQTGDVDERERDDEADDDTEQRGSKSCQQKKMPLKFWCRDGVETHLQKRSGLPQTSYIHCVYGLQSTSQPQGQEGTDQEKETYRFSVPARPMWKNDRRRSMTSNASHRRQKIMVAKVAERARNTRREPGSLSMLLFELVPRSPLPVGASRIRSTTRGYRAARSTHRNRRR